MADEGLLQVSKWQRDAADQARRDEFYWRRAHLGDHVFDVADPRHVGRLEAIRWSHSATVRWLETGWLSDVPLADLRPYREDR